MAAGQNVLGHYNELVRGEGHSYPLTGLLLEAIFCRQLN